MLTGGAREELSRRAVWWPRAAGAVLVTLTDMFHHEDLSRRAVRRPRAAGAVLVTLTEMFHPMQTHMCSIVWRVMSLM